MKEKEWFLEDTPAHKTLRQALVDEISRQGIASDQVLTALATVPRHYFVPATVSAQEAYTDKALPIGQKQTISQPYTVAYQTELLDVQPSSKILEVGTGSGYQAAILFQLTPAVYTIEYNETLYRHTRQLFERLHYSIQVFYGDGSQGLPMCAPFDRIVVTAGAPEVPEPLLDQLTLNGKLVIPTGTSNSQKMLRITRKGEQQFDTETFDLFSFVPLRGKHGWK